MEFDTGSKTEFDLKPLDKTKFLQEHESVSSSSYRNIIKSTAIIVIYSAAAVASSTSLVLIPNLETITIFIFLVSFYYGFKIGLSMMLTTSIIYELFASVVYGFSGPLFFFKIIAYLINVVIASTLASVMKQDFFNTQSQGPKITFISRIGFAVLGFTLTVVFDLITTFYSFFLVQNLKAFVLLFIAGIPYILFHELTNVVIFFFVPDYLHIMKFSTKTNFYGSN